MTKRLDNSRNFLLVFIFLVFLFLFLFPSFAFANYYAYGGRNFQNVYAVNGGGVVIDVQAYTAPDYRSWGHTNTSLWLFTHGYITPSHRYWVEVGLTKGYHGRNWTTFYVAQRNPGGYGDHALLEYDPGPVGTQHHYIINYAGNTNWHVWIDRQYVYNLHGNQPGIPRMQVGLETTSYYASVPQTHLNTIQWHQTDGRWHNFDRGATRRYDFPPYVFTYYFQDYTRALLYRKAGY